MRGLPKCYLLHTSPSKFRELRKTCQATCFSLSTLDLGALLNILLDPPNHDSQNSPNETYELGSWAENEILCHELKLWVLVRLYCHEFWTMGFDIILWIWTLLGFKRDFPRIHDNVDVMWVANEMKPCGMKEIFLNTS